MKLMEAPMTLHCKRATSAAMAEYWLSQHPEVKELYEKTHEMAVRLIETYAEYLTPQEKCKARALYWGRTSPEEYEDIFFHTLLWQSYNVYDESHKRYTKLLEAVRKNNPDRVSFLEKDHAYKVAACKVAVYPI